MGVEVVEKAAMNGEIKPEIEKQKLNVGEEIGGNANDAGKGEAADANFPKDAVSEWPAAKPIHSFYFVRLRPYDDPKVKSKIEVIDKEIQKRNKSRIQITDELRAKRAERAELKSNVRSLISDSQKYRAMMEEKRREMGPLQQALGKLHAGNAGRSGLCSSEEELNDLIYSLKYRIQHESIPLSEEKQILREIKMLEGTREKVVANAALRAKIEESLGQKEAIQDQVKLMGVNMDGVKKEQQAVSSKINQLDEKVKAIDKEISALQEELNAVSQKRDEAYESIKALRTQRDEGNSLFYQSRTLITQVKELAANKNIKALEELSNSEVEKFMSLWNGSKSFRDDYEKRLLPSLDSRFLSRDGRMRNPNEKPLLAEAADADSSVATAPNPPAKQPKEDAKPAVQIDAPPAPRKEVKEKEAPAPDDELKFESPVKVVVDEAKLKEMKREEEIVKAKQAMERKKKLAERAALKAAAKAQKDAEKKIKEREKKLKKKASAAAPASEAVEAAEEVVAEDEPEAVKEEALAPPAKQNNIRNKEKGLKNRTRPRAGERLPKAILMKRKSSNYMMWAAAAAVVLLLALVLGYLYLLA